MPGIQKKGFCAHKCTLKLIFCNIYISSLLLITTNTSFTSLKSLFSANAQLAMMLGWSIFTIDTVKNSVSVFKESDLKKVTFCSLFET